MPKTNLFLLSKEVHQWSLEQGFWEDATELEKRILIISEISEMIDAHRNNSFINVDVYFEDNDFFLTEFKFRVKNTVEEEFGDIIIRILDLYQHYSKIEKNDGKKVPMFDYSDYINRFYEKNEQYDKHQFIEACEKLIIKTLALTNTTNCINLLTDVLNLSLKVDVNAKHYTSVKHHYNLNKKSESEKKY